MDSFTKWTEAFLLRNKEAETVAKVLVEQVFTRFGTPLSVLSDQGKEVDGRIMNEICRLFGIEKLRTSPYKPSTNREKNADVGLEDDLFNRGVLTPVDCGRGGTPAQSRHVEG